MRGNMKNKGKQARSRRRKTNHLLIDSSDLDGVVDLAVSGKNDVSYSFTNTHRD
jgi:hypothetical protein